MTQLMAAEPIVEEYLDKVRARLTAAPTDTRDNLVGQLRAKIDLETEIRAGGSDPAELRSILERIGRPEMVADELLKSVGITEGPYTTSVSATMKQCRTCAKEVSAEAVTCPHCGAPRPTQRNWNGTGYEWKSKQMVCGYPLVHVAVGRDKNGKLRVAKGVIAIGQFGVGAITIAQFGVGFVFGLGQFVAAPLCIAQFALGLFALGQFGIALLGGVGQFATGLWFHYDMRNLIPPTGPR